MKILHLTLKKKWFDMILSGEKPEEYREIKPYWIKRLMCCEDEENKDSLEAWSFLGFDVIKFKNGYSKTAREMTIEHFQTDQGQGRAEWGGGAKEVFIIHLGKIISTRNC